MKGNNANVLIVDITYIHYNNNKIKKKEKYGQASIISHFNAGGGGVAWSGWIKSSDA